MEVYRISRINHSYKLTASGSAARWNSKGKFVIYTAATRALACLENVVHRSGEDLNDFFKVMIIQIPEGIPIGKVDPSKLPEEWFQFHNYPQCQAIGNKWLEKGETAVVKVPSSIIHLEFNYLINPFHSDFNKITLAHVEDFIFDPRIKPPPWPVP